MGNRVTANRWAGLLRSLGHRVRVVTSFRGRPDVLIALHARRSAESIRAFREEHPQKPLVVALTGTDVYRDIHQDAQARRSLRLASRLVVLQRAALDELPAAVRRKGRVILQSASPRRRRRARGGLLRIVVVGHLRAEKDPFRVAEALALIPDVNVEVRHAGRALEPSFARTARAWMRRERRYRWIGELSPSRARQMIADGDALVLTSLLEGGANVISEAVVCAVPVLASRIPSSVALLGSSYRGFFDTGDERSLALLMRRFAEKEEFRRRLTREISRLRPRFTPHAEREAWRRLLAEW